MIARCRVERDADRQTVTQCFREGLSVQSGLFVLFPTLAAFQKLPETFTTDEYTRRRN